MLSRLRTFSSIRHPVSNHLKISRAFSDARTVVRAEEDRTWQQVPGARHWVCRHLRPFASKSARHKAEEEKIAKRIA
eukprot:6203876-Pleurochrysis_carterae.AAC.2